MRAVRFNEKKNELKMTIEKKEKRRKIRTRIRK
jgi:hypothetical protein